MRRLLSTTTALSLVFAPLQPLSLGAQTLAEDGALLAEDGAILCAAGDAAPCDLESILTRLAELGQTEVSPATLEALTTALGARAAAEAAALEAELKRAEDEAAAEAAREAEAIAAEAQAQKAAEAEAAALEAELKRAEDEAAAEAAGEAEAIAAEAQAQKAAEAEAAALEAELKRAEDEAAAEAAREAESIAADAEAQKAAEVEAAALEAELKRAEEEAAAADTATSPIPEPASEGTVAEAPVAEAEVIALEDLPEDTQAAFESATAAEAAVAEAPVEQAEVAPVDVPLVSAEEVQTLSNLLGGDPAAAVAAVGAAAGLLATLGGAPATTTEPLGTTTATAPDTAAATAPVSDTPTEVNVTTITEADTRSSFEEFTAAPTLLEGGRQKSGLSDLEKAGLLALGAIVVGNLLSDGREVVANTGDRVVVRQPDGEFQVYKDDDTLLRRPGNTLRTETYKDGSTRTLIEREDGSQVVTIRDATGRVLRRAVYDQRGVETLLIDDLEPEERIDVTTLPVPRPARLTISANGQDASLRAELARIEAQQIGRTFSLRQIREVPQVRKLAAVLDVDNITFDSGSAVIRTTEARKLAAIGRTMDQLLAENPDEVFLVEGHTDAVGSASANLTLSDRRAESVALALTEYFGIPPENLVVQGYGEYDLRVDTQANERLNRRAAVRVITPLMRTAELR